MKTKGVKSFHFEWNNHLQPIYGDNGIIDFTSSYQTQSWYIELENGKIIQGEKLVKRKRR